MRRLASAALALAATAAPALAHEGDPRPWGIHFPAGDAQRAWVVDEMGVLLERGAGFEWLCDNAISQTEGLRTAQPTLADGRRWLVTTRTGVRLSEDGGCTFAPAPGEPFGGRAIGPVAPHLGAPAELALGTAAVGQANDLFVTADGGRTWRAAGLARPGTFQSILRAPSQPDRLYASTDQALLVSDDGGARAAEVARRFEGVDAQLDTFRLLAVDPRRPDRLYAALDHFPDGLLLRSEDAGRTWRLLATVSEDVVETLALDPTDGRLLASTPFSGALRSDDDGATWRALPTPGVLGCLEVDPRDASVWACLRGNPLPWVVAQSADFGETWAPRLPAYAAIAGQVQCPPGTPTHDICSLECDPADRACRGQPDAGVADAGEIEPPERQTAVESGCQSVPLAAPWWLAALALMARRRRRDQGELVAGS